MAKFKVVKLRNGGVKLYQDGAEIKDIANLEVRHHAIPGKTMLTNINIQITSTDVEVVNEPENGQQEAVQNLGPVIMMNADGTYTKETYIE